MHSMGITRSLTSDDGGNDNDNDYGGDDDDDDDGAVRKASQKYVCVLPPGFFGDYAKFGLLYYISLRVFAVFVFVYTLVLLCIPCCCCSGCGWRLCPVWAAQLY